MIEEFISNIPIVTPKENIILTTPFTEKEMLDALMKMEPNKSLGPDRFPAKFYQCS